MRVFAGLRSDPAFFDRQGALATVASGRASLHRAERLRGRQRPGDRRRARARALFAPRRGHAAGARGRRRDGAEVAVRRAVRSSRRCSPLVPLLACHAAQGRRHGAGADVYVPSGDDGGRGAERGAVPEASLGPGRSTARGIRSSRCCSCRGRCRTSTTRSRRFEQNVPRVLQDALEARLVALDTLDARRRGPRPGRLAHPRRRDAPAPADVRERRAARRHRAARALGATAASRRATSTSSARSSWAAAAAHDVRRAHAERGRRRRDADAAGDGRTRAR